ncbi:MAG: FtsX-like permease family protein [Myxococcota bacterium]
MRFPFLVALSHLRSRKSEKGISVITFVSMMGVTVGVTALIMVLAVMEGFELDLRDKILGSNAHLVVVNYNGNFTEYESKVEAVEATEGVRSASPFVYAEVMIRSERGASGVVFKGIDPLKVSEVTDVASNIKIGPGGVVNSSDDKRKVMEGLHRPERGLFQALDDDDELPGILLGEELANQLWVGVGDRVHIINPVGQQIGIMGVPTPDLKTFRVAGVFYSGMYEYDTKWTYVTLEDAQSFLKLDGQINGIEARVDPIDEAGAISAKVEMALQYPFHVRHWKELNRNLFSALKLEKIVMGLILSLIVMVASLNIVGTLILVVLTRGREISILRAMGASKSQITRIFMLEGVIIGLVGTLSGTVLGLIGCELLDRYRFPLDTDVYYLDSLPVVVEYPTVGIVILAALSISFLATIYPARIAARMSPVEGLRYE